MSDHEQHSTPFMNDQSPEGFPFAAWIQHLKKLLMFNPASSQELREVLIQARKNNILDSQVLHIMEGALSVGDTRVDEIMVPRPQMTVLKYDQTPEQLLKAVVDSGHSRFPVIGDTIDDIKGILLAKTLLPLLLKGAQQLAHFRVDSVLRPAYRVPETKHVNDLLREFREKRHHMAIVVDEYGGVSGLVTIEDILEEIVGDIEDETDETEENHFIRPLNQRDYLVKALAPIEEFNKYFKANLSDEEYDTIGGLLTKEFGHLPRRNEMISLENFRFRVLNADSRQVHLLRLSIPEPALETDES
jgi:magnesium and cobalt transporter